MMVVNIAQFYGCSCFLLKVVPFGVVQTQLIAIDEFKQLIKVEFSPIFPVFLQLNHHLIPFLSL